MVYFLLAELCVKQGTNSNTEFCSIMLMCECSMCYGQATHSNAGVSASGGRSVARPSFGITPDQTRGVCPEKTNHTYHFLCLKTKKVTKENSRKKVLLRTFFLAHAQVTLLLAWSLHYD